MPPEDRFIHIGCVNTRYWLAGRGSPVVLIHGLGGYIENWLPCLAALTSEHTVYAPDMVGFGRTDKPCDASYTIDGLAHFVADFMDAMRLPQAAIAGYSMGGVALRFALGCTQRVDRLALISAAGLGRGGSPLLAFLWLPLLGELLSKPSLQHSRANAQGISYHADFPNDMLYLDYEMNAQPGATTIYLKTLRQLGNLLGQDPHVYQPHLQALAGFHFPILVIWGRQDPVIPAAHANAVARVAPSAQVHILEHCGHVPVFECSEEVSRLLVEF